MTQIKTCRELAEEHPEVKWTPRREFCLYNHPGARLRVVVENAEIEHLGIGLGRHEAYAEVGIYDADIDAEELGKDFVEDFCHHLSLHEMDAVIRHMTAARDAWEAQRQRNQTLYIDTFGKD